MRPLRTPTAPTADAARKTKHTDAADGKRSNAPPIRPCPLSLNAVAWALCQHPNPASGPVLGVLRRAFRVFVLVPRFLDWSKVRTSMRSLRRMSVLRPKEGDFGGSRGELQTRAVVGNKRMPAGGLACRTFKFLSKKKKKQVQAQVRGEKDAACRNPEERQWGKGRETKPTSPHPPNGTASGRSSAARGRFQKTTSDMIPPGSWFVEEGTGLPGPSILFG